MGAAANFAWLRWVSAWEDVTGGEVWSKEDGKRAFMAGWEACAAEERRADGAAIFRKAVSDLHMAGIRTGADYERVVGEIVAEIYGPPRKPAVFNTASCEER